MKIHPSASLTAEVRKLIRSRNDDGNKHLQIFDVDDGSVEVKKANGAELSETEKGHVRGILAAFGVKMTR